MTMFLFQCEWMPASDDIPEPEGLLAREAGTLRSSLSGYFRRRVRDRTEVDDLVQEVFVRIVGRDSMRPVEHLGRYVLRTAASVLADRGRRRSARRADAHVLFDPDYHGEEDLDADRILAGREELRAATAALLSLPERTRTIFVLHRLEGCRYHEIAAQLGISVSAVEKHMMRAIRHLTAFAGERHDT
jgi:RNA polymerase sigma-70 factor (ECF subfamily)